MRKRNVGDARTTKQQGEKESTRRRKKWREFLERPLLSRHIRAISSMQSGFSNARKKIQKIGGGGLNNTYSTKLEQKKTTKFFHAHVKEFQIKKRRKKMTSQQNFSVLPSPSGPDPVLRGIVCGFCVFIRTWRGEWPPGRGRNRWSAWSRASPEENPKKKPKHQKNSLFFPRKWSLMSAILLH